MTPVERLYRDVQIDLSNAHTYGVSWREMGADAGLSPQTIKKFAMGETTRPSFQTVVLLAQYAGRVVTIGRERKVDRLAVVTQYGKSSQHRSSK